MNKTQTRNTFYHGDCKFVLNHDIPLESIDLIYLDPPFFTGQVQKGQLKPNGQQKGQTNWQPGAMEVSFDDSRRFWKEKGVSEHATDWLKYIAGERPDFAAYLYYMMERLKACRKVLKQTGSIYLHCDWRASHYLKMVMDEVFGPEKLQNEVIWHYFTASSKSKSHFARKHDTIFFYTKSNKYTFNLLEAKRRLGFKPVLPNVARNVRYGSDEAGHYSISILDDVWDIGSVFNLKKEFTGYPTQKPLALLKRIILASSNEGDIVLDPFCGCGTAIVAAHELTRRWIGIDINKTAYEVSKGREVQLALGTREEFAHAAYVSRDLGEVKEMDGREFEKWVNEFHNAEKPSPDKGVDGFTIADGIPIQTKTSQIGYEVLSKFITDAKYHPNRTKAMTRIIIVSQTGFDDKARQRKFEIETAENIQILFATPEEMLDLDRRLLWKNESSA